MEKWFPPATMGSEGKAHFNRLRGKGLDPLSHLADPLPHS